MKKYQSLEKWGFLVYNGRLLRELQGICVNFVYLEIPFVQLSLYKSMGNETAYSFKGAQEYTIQL